MAYTWQQTFDNLSLHAIQVPVGASPGRKISMRELATDASQVGYNVAAPNATNSTFPKFAGEVTEFNQYAGRIWNSGDIPGYVQPNTGTVTFSFLLE